MGWCSGCDCFNRYNLLVDTMTTEGIVISVVFMSFIVYRVWKSRKMIRDMYLTGFNIMCERFGLPPYIPKEKKDEKTN